MRKQNRIVFDYYYSRKLDDLDIFFCFFQKCAFHGKIPVWTKREFDDRSMTASIRFVSRLFRDSRDILLTASRPIVPRSMNRFANAFPFRRRRIGLAISAHPIGISRATPRTATKFILPERLILQRQKDSLGRCRTRFVLWNVLTRFALIVKIIFPEIGRGRLSQEFYGITGEVNKCLVSNFVRVVSTDLSLPIFLEIMSRDRDCDQRNAFES